MKTTMLSLASPDHRLLFASQTNAFLPKKSATWKGGQPGQPTEWNCAKNWLENRVPNEFSAVVIPDCSTTTFSDPVLKTGEVEVYSLEIHSGAKLLIGKNARLIATEQPGNELTAFTAGVILHG